MRLCAVLSLVPQLVASTIASSACPNGCRGQGICLSSGKCRCFQGFTGFDCKLRACPVGKQWTGTPAATDDIHTARATCSNMGVCDESTGKCMCRSGFGGPACERMTCPNKCSNNGRCLSMRDAALLDFGDKLNRTLAYSLWDADRIYGCVCDRGFHGYDCSLRDCPVGDDPLTTGQSDEVHTLICACTGCGGSFMFSFLGEHIAIPHDAPMGIVKARLESLPTIREISISFDGTNTVVCSAAGTTTTITYLQDPGDLQAASVTSTALTGSGISLTFQTIQKIACTCSTCSGSIFLMYDGETTAAIAHDAATSDVKSALEALSDISTVTVTYDTGAVLCAASAVTTSVTFVQSMGNTPKMGVISSLTGAGTPSISITSDDGTKEKLECSGRGTCTATTGICSCYAYNTAANGWHNYTHSNGKGASGSRGDCGYHAYTPTTCPISSVKNVVSGVSENQTCSGHGTCDGSTFACTCYDGWTGGDCAARTCATGKAWFDEASTTNVAHAPTECSNKGLCDRKTGKCTCQSGWGGAACARMECLGDVGRGVCNNNGVCKSLSQLAGLATSNGAALGYTYGSTPYNAATWDHDMIYSCLCDAGWHHEPDQMNFSSHWCSQRPCPKGDNPKTLNQVNELQTITCTATTGTFTVSFRGQTTGAIAYDADNIEVMDALQALSSIGNVSVVFNTVGAVVEDACSASGVAIGITFNSELGDLPILSTDATNLGGGTASVAETTKGTKENSECSEQGVCDQTTGKCKCFPGFSSSDGNGNMGTRGDCGFINMAARGDCTFAKC